MARLAVIGFGSLGTAIATGAAREGALRAEDVLVLVRDSQRGVHAATLGFESTMEMAEALACEQILLAVKPQSFEEVARSMGKIVRPTLIISVMAGITIARLQAAFGQHARLVRAIPNTPVRVSMGMTVIAASPTATTEDIGVTTAIFTAVGEVLRAEEALLNAATAISGSGPAFVYYLAEAWIASAVNAGFAPDAARSMVTQTILGAAKLLKESGETPEALRAAVTSKGGTTAAAIGVLEVRGFHGAFTDALAAAAARAAELSRSR